MQRDRSAIESLVGRILASDVRAVARGIRLVDDRDESAIPMLKALYPHTGAAYVVGVTGTPGAGKSTLVDQMVAMYRARGLRVAALAVDPTSPYSGGAILGDRIRMQRHFLDEGVFIRSLATRGHLGGLSRSAADVLRVVDAAGFDIVILETVGVGQDELEVTRLAHTTCVVTAPGLGDDIQAIKAGILEVADVFAVNKADRDGALATVRDLEQMIALGADVRRAGGPTVRHGHAAARSLNEAESDATETTWTPKIVQTTATRGEGMEGLLSAIDVHRALVWEADQGSLAARVRLENEILSLVRDRVVAEVDARLRDRLPAELSAIEEGGTDPYSVVERLLSDVLSVRSA